MVPAVSEGAASLSDCHVTTSSLPFDGSLYKLKDRERERAAPTDARSIDKNLLGFSWRCSWKLVFWDVTPCRLVNRYRRFVRSKIFGIRGEQPSIQTPVLAHCKIFTVRHGAASSTTRPPPPVCCTLPIIMRVRETAMSKYLLRHACLSVRPHGTTRLPQGGFS